MPWRGRRSAGEAHVSQWADVRDSRTAVGNDPVHGEGGETDVRRGTWDVKGTPDSVRCAFHVPRPTSHASSHSPYGIQMFFTCVASRRKSRPSPSPADIHSRGSHSANVRFMLPALASSTAFTPSRVPKYHTASTSSCSARVFASESL